MMPMPHAARAGLGILSVVASALHSATCVAALQDPDALASTAAQGLRRTPRRRQPCQHKAAGLRLHRWKSRRRQHSPCHINDGCKQRSLGAICLLSSISIASLSSLTSLSLFTSIVVFLVGIIAILGHKPHLCSMFEQSATAANWQARRKGRQQRAGKLAQGWLQAQPAGRRQRAGKLAKGRAGSKHSHQQRAGSKHSLSPSLSASSSSSSPHHHHPNPMAQAGQRLAPSTAGRKSVV